jgi:hypothetical protein
MFAFIQFNFYSTLVLSSLHELASNGPDAALLLQQKLMNEATQMPQDGKMKFK